MVVMVAGVKIPPNIISSFPIADEKGSTVAEAVLKKATYTMVENRKKTQTK